MQDRLIELEARAGEGATGVSKQAEGRVTRTIDYNLKELKDEEKRKNNIVIHNTKKKYKNRK